MAKIAILKLIFLVNGLEVCAIKKRFQDFQGRFIAYNHSGLLGSAVLWHEGNHCDCDQLIAKFDIATGDDSTRLWNEFELSYVGSWHTLNRQHCRLSLMWTTFCEKTVCLARCDRERKNDLAERWAYYCADHWQKEVDEFKKGLSDEFQVRPHTQKHDLWMKKAMQTLPPCEVCVEAMSDQESQEADLPDACKKENHVHTIVGKLLDSPMSAPETPQLSGNETTADSHHTRSVPSPVLVSDFCQQECSYDAQTLDKIWATPVSTNSSAQKFYDEIGYTWVQSWHFMNRMHCYVALASLKWCQRNSCYWRCPETRGKPKSECQTIWEGDYTKGVDTLRQKTLDELIAKNIPSEHAHRWWDIVVTTFEVCAPCADNSAAKSIPQPCWKEYNTYAEVWFQSLPENKENHHGGSRSLSSREIFNFGIGGIAIVAGVYWCARNWFYSRSRCQG